MIRRTAVSTTIKSRQPTARLEPATGPTTEAVWRQLRKASFAVVSHVTPAGDPRSSGVVYTIIGQRMYVVVARDSWKARHIVARGEVAVTVPVRRGGIMSLLFPIPPATISFHARAFVHRSESPEARQAMRALARLLPADRHDSIRIIEIRPEGWFLTYGLDVSLNRMRDPALARARVAVA
jgi:hypothetical protein